MLKVVSLFAWYGREPLLRSFELGLLGELYPGDWAWSHLFPSNTRLGVPRGRHGQRRRMHPRIQPRSGVSLVCPRRRRQAQRWRRKPGLGWRGFESSGMDTPGFASLRRGQTSESPPSAARRQSFDSGLGYLRKRSAQLSSLASVTFSRTCCRPLFSPPGSVIICSTDVVLSR